MATQAGLTVILASLAPFTAFWYISGNAYQPAILFNGRMFAVASFSAQWMLRRDYIPLIRENPRHRWMLRTWIVIYVFVGIQMGWVLRPFIGDPTLPVQFFREGSWSNAYEVVILAMIWDALMGRGEMIDDECRSGRGSFRRRRPSSSRTSRWTFRRRWPISTR